MRRGRRFKLVETGLVILSLWWGTLLLTPLKDYDQCVYIAMDNMFPAVVWSIICFFISLILFIGMIIRNIKLRSIGLLLSTGLWTFVAVSLILAGRSALVTGSYFIWSGLAASVYIHMLKVGDGQ
jgi:hypothetical protein